MLSKRIIPCLDVDNGRVVKGINFSDIRDAGDPVEVAQRYNEEGADEITFLDITATKQQRNAMVETVAEVAKHVFIPLTVGGGIAEIKDISRLLHAGADKVSINSAAVREPQFIQSAAEHFGSQCIVAAIDAKQTHYVERGAEANRWQIFTHGGSRETGLDAIKWALQLVELGAGEILLTSMDGDGTRQGYDLELTAAISNAVSVPVIASGGVGQLQHLVDGVVLGKADAVLAASIFHFQEYSIADAKRAMVDAGIAMRTSTP